MAHGPGSEPVRQGGEPRRPDRPRHPASTRSATSTCRRRCAGTSPTRTSPATSRRCCRPTPRRTPRSPTPSCTASTRSRTTRSRSAAGCSRRLPGRRPRPRCGSRSTPGTGSATTRSSAAAARCAPAWSPSAATRRHVLSGVKELVLLNSTDSEFKGFLKDEFTTLRRDRRPDPGHVPGRDAGATPATAVQDMDWNASYDAVLDTHPRAPSPAPTPARCRRRSTRWAPPSSRRSPGSPDISFSAPNKHHFLVDFSGFDVEGLTNDGEVFIAADRPYGLIEATVVRDRRDDARGAARLPLGAALGRRRARRPAVRRTARRCSTPPTRPPATLTDEELDQALSGHPRIGERGGAQSQQEQSGVDPTAGDTAARLAAGNAAYEERFDRVFLIRAAGRDADEILAELDRRLQQRRRHRARRDRRQPAPDRAAAAGGASL